MPSRFDYVPDFVWRSAAETAREFLALFDVVRASSELRGEAAAKLDAEAAALDADIDELVQIGRLGNVFADVSFVALDAEFKATPLVDRVFALLQHYREAVTPEIAVEGLKQLSDFGDDLQPIPNTTHNRRIEAQNRQAMVDLFRRSALAQLVVATVEASYPARREAIAARADIEERFSAELARIVRPEEWEVAQALRELMGLTIEFLSKLMADLAPVIVVESGVRLPTLYWAYRLYGDAKRGDELWARNDVKHPMWLPGEFEALAR